MGEFFKRWQRKAGCVALMLAIALTFGWLRSEFITDRLYFGKSLLESTGGATHFSWMEDSDDIELSWDSQERKSYDGNTRGVLRGEYLWHPVWRYSLAGLEIGFVEDRRLGMKTAYFAQCPYQWIVLPLTLLSAPLILWRPRKRNSFEPSTTSNVNSN